MPKADIAVIRSVDLIVQPDAVLSTPYRNAKPLRFSDDITDDDASNGVESAKSGHWPVNTYRPLSASFEFHQVPPPHRRFFVNLRA
jgi:hypothetical protein